VKGPSPHPPKQKTPSPAFCREVATRCGGRSQDLTQGGFCGTCRPAAGWRSASHPGPPDTCGRSEQPPAERENLQRQCTAVMWRTWQYSGITQATAGLPQSPHPCIHMFTNFRHCVYMTNILTEDQGVHVSSQRAWGLLRLLQAGHTLRQLHQSGCNCVSVPCVYA
jgi:hypothetical protein